MTEKRKYERVKEENRIVIEVYQAGGEGDTFTTNAFTRDLSLTGARIWTDKLFSLNSKLILILYLSRSKQIVRIRGTVRWTKNCDDGLYEIGVEFQHEIPNALLALIQHLYGKDQGIPTSVKTVEDP